MATEDPRHNRSQTRVVILFGLWSCHQTEREKINSNSWINGTSLSII